MGLPNGLIALYRQEVLHIVKPQNYPAYSSSKTQKFLEDKIISYK